MRGFLNAVSAWGTTFKIQRLSALMCGRLFYFAVARTVTEFLSYAAYLVYDIDKRSKNIYNKVSAFFKVKYT